MIFSKNVTNISLLESELKQLKAVYRKALEAKNNTTLKDLRKNIKVLQARWETMCGYTLTANPDTQKT